MNRMTDFIALELIEGTPLSVSISGIMCGVHVSIFFITLSISGYYFEQ